MLKLSSMVHVHALGLSNVWPRVYRQEILSIQKKMSSNITNSQIKYIRYTEWDIINIYISFGILWRIFNNIGWELEKIEISN